MEKDIERIKRLYEGFNKKDTDAVLVLLTEDVKWANAMDGGHAKGHDGIRKYWTRQWSMVNPHVEPIDFKTEGDGSISVKVIQTIRDLDGNLLQGQTHGLKDKTVQHIFRLKDGLVTNFDVEDML